MKLGMKLGLVVIVAVMLVSCDKDKEINNFYSIDGVEYTIDSTMFWYQPSSSMGGMVADPYIRLLTSVDGQDNPDLLKLYPSKGLGDLERTYTWNADGTEGTYDAGYTGNYEGMSYDWTANAKTGSTDLIVTKNEDGTYKIDATIELSIGSYDWETGDFTEDSTATLVLDYEGVVQALDPN